MIFWFCALVSTFKRVRTRGRDCATGCPSSASAASAASVPTTDRLLLRRSSETVAQSWADQMFTSCFVSRSGGD
ncbi:hypothetical protein V8F33_011481 [Rhypophila sp. PSN 637]